MGTAQDFAAADAALAVVLGEIPRGEPEPPPMLPTARPIIDDRKTTVVQRRRSPSWEPEKRNERVEKDGALDSAAQPQGDEANAKRRKLRKLRAAWRRQRREEQLIKAEKEEKKQREKER